MPEIYKIKTIYLFFSILFFGIFGLVKESQAADSRFIQLSTWQGYLGTTLENYAKYSITMIPRLFYNIAPFNQVKSLNPSHEIYAYENGTYTSDFQDAYDVENMNTIGRWNNARGHSMGNLNVDNADLFLHNIDTGMRYYNNYYNTWRLDFGSAKYQKYWIEAALTDLWGSNPWRMDGIFIDDTPSARGAKVEEYQTNADWNNAMNSFTLAISAALHAQGAKAYFNHGSIRYDGVKDVWMTLDADPNHPDILMEEGTFVVKWGATGNQIAHIYEEHSMKNAIDAMSAIHNMKIIIGNHIAGTETSVGTDQYGKTLSYWDGLWLSLECFLLGRNDADNNSYFDWYDSDGKIKYFDEYDIDLGSAVKTYQITPYNGHNIYWREFQKGYVYVNPTDVDMAAISLPQIGKELNHGNLKNDPGAISDTSIISLTAHRGTIVLKSAPPPSAPGGLSVR